MSRPASFTRQLIGIVGAACIAFAITAASPSAVAQDERAPLSPEFVYQGLLTSGGVPVDGVAHDFAFTLIDCTTLGVVAGPIVQTLVPDNGLFTTNPPLNFGLGAWNGDERCLRIAVRPAGIGGFTVLAPDQEVTPAPYAIRAMGAPPIGAAGGDLSGTYPNPGIAANAVGAAEIAANAVGNSEMADNAIGSAEIINGSIQAIDLANGIIGPNKLDTSGAVAGDVLGFDGVVADWTPDSLTLPYSATNSVALNAFQIDHTGAGTGRVMLLRQTNAGALNFALRVDHSGSNYAIGGIGFGAGGALYGESDGADPTLRVRQFGTGGGVEVTCSDPNNESAAIYAVNSTGMAAHLDGSVQIGSAAREGRVDVYTNGLATPLITAFDNGFGGEVIVDDDDGSTIVRLGDDFINGDGAELLMSTAAGVQNIALTTSISGDDQPQLYLTGTSRTIGLDTGSADSASVVLPTNAIQDSEILDEPGVASAANGTGSASIDSTTPTIIDSQTIACPTSGYVLVMATAQFNVSHATGTTSSYNVGVSDASASLPANQDVAVFFSSALPSASIDLPVTVHGLFSVSAGNNTFYFLAEKISSTAPNASTNDSQLTLVFLPTAYGTVEPTLPDGRAASDDDAEPVVWTSERLEARKTASIAANQARIEAEMAQMRAELIALRELLAAEKGGATEAPSPVAQPSRPLPQQRIGENDN